jgi:hypothetical protein
VKDARSPGPLASFYFFSDPAGDCVGCGVSGVRAGGVCGILGALGSLPDFSARSKSDNRGSGISSSLFWWRRRRRGRYGWRAWDSTSSVTIWNTRWWRRWRISSFGAKHYKSPLWKVYLQCAIFVFVYSIHPTRDSRKLWPVFFNFERLAPQFIKPTSKARVGRI